MRETLIYGDQVLKIPLGAILFRIKYYGVNLFKRVKEFYKEYCLSLKKVVESDARNGKTFSAYGFVELIMSKLP